MSVTLKIAGQVYQRWTSVRVTRGLKRATSDFSFEVPGEIIPAIRPFQPCSVSDGADLLLTGYVVSVSPDISARETRSVITGQSKTQDFVDCMPEFDTNQFNGNTLDAIARSLAAPFGINVVIGPGVQAGVIGNAFPDATFERSETAFAFLERLARQRGVLLTDDAAGNLVLATAGAGRAPGSLVMGQDGNVSRAQGGLNGKDRFSKYTILSQVGVKQTGSDVQTDIEAVAVDGGVPRYRPWAGMAESASMSGDAQIRANWEAAHRIGLATNAKLTVPEWRANGTLWQQNEIVKCSVPRLGLDANLLIGEIEYQLDASGKRTLLSVAPPAAFTPQPLSTAAQSAVYDLIPIR